MVQRRGKPRKPDYVTSWGETLTGAYLGSDGRLRPTGKSTPAFGPAADERLAVHRFKLWRTKNDPNAIEPVEMNWESGEAVRQHIRNLILSDPHEAAKYLGVPHLSQYPVTPDKPANTLLGLATQYVASRRNADGRPLDKKYAKNLPVWWKDFCEMIGNPKYPQNVTRQMIQTYYSKIMEQFDNGKSPAFVRSRFSAVKAIVKFGLEYTDDKTECRRLLDECAILKPPREITNPQPISPDDYRKLLDKADLRMRAVLLLGINAAMHLGEVARTLKEHVNLAQGTLAARRTKTSNPRACKLFERTVKAVQKYLDSTKANQTPFLFISRNGKPMTGEALRQKFVTLRRKAKVPDHVTFEGVRDAALTIADQVDPYYTKLLAGHKTGQKDNYVLRQATNPKIVECCIAIEKHFFAV